MRLLLPVAVTLLLSACPPTNSQPCAQDSECRADQRCRRGACGPICEGDAECGDAQVCRAGVCIPRPECAQDADCASGFACLADRCQCQTDAVCGANQTCVNGACQSRKACTADADCIGAGGRCEVTQGLCLPVCTLPQDCAPTLDPRVALALYSCVQGTCTRRCTTDPMCGGQGFICTGGLCRAADCQTMTDCPSGQYCTGAAFGRCSVYQECAGSSTCPQNSECKTFTQATCPPGFDCSKKLCQELPRCLSDGDCLNGIPGAPTTTQTGYCFEGHCQATASCTTAAQCTSEQVCIASLCVPGVCRGHPDCGTGKACVDGSCVGEPSPGELNLLHLSPRTAVLEVGDTLQLHLVGFKLDGTSFPLTQGAYEVVDSTGQPSAAATVDAAGLLTAAAPGQVVVRASVTGSVLAPLTATVSIYPTVTVGRRVLVVDAASKAPLPGTQVRACEEPCAAPVDVVADADGVADFPALGAGAATFTAVAQDLRSDGLPAHERVSVLSTLATDVYLPLKENSAKSRAGFNGSLSFIDVSTTGSSWAGFIATSVSDLPSWTTQNLTGDAFQTPIPGLGQSVPVPGALVLYTSPAFGIPQEVKSRSLGFSQPGTRFGVAFAGRGTLDQTFFLRSTDFLGYLGAFDYALDTQLAFAAKPMVPDTADVNGNGLCTDLQKCPMGSEDVPDYANFTRLSFRPHRQQQRRTEVVVPNLPSNFDTVLVSAVELDPEAGMLPVGFASATAQVPTSDGTRPVAPLTVRSGTPYNGVEISTPGIWALAGSATGSSVSGRLMHAQTLPLKVLVTPFLPSPTNCSYAPATRTFSPGQPQWASVYSSGGELARVSITGTEQRHTIYFALQGTQTAVRFPPTPSGPGADPAGESGVALEVVAVDLSGTSTVDEVFTLRSTNLSNWVTAIDGYTRFDR